MALEAYFHGIIFVVCSEHVIICSSLLSYYLSVQIFMSQFSILGLAVTEITPNEIFPLYNYICILCDTHTHVLSAVFSYCECLAS